MEKLKRALFKLLFPGTAVVVICTLAAAAALVWAFAIAPEGHPLTYAAYVLSFYALVILCANAVPIVRRGRSWAKSNKYVERYFEWQGNFSFIFLAFLQPASFGEQYYGLTAVITLTTYKCQ